PERHRRRLHRGGGRAVPRRAGRNRHPGLLADPRRRPRRHRRDRGTGGATADDRSEGNGRDGPRRSRTRWHSMTPGEHGTASPIEILPVTGLPEFRPGDDLAAALTAAAPWLQDGDVLVVTSKVLSKCEGRLVPAPEDPEERDTLRRKLVDAESVRV